VACQPEEQTIRDVSVHKAADLLGAGNEAAAPMLIDVREVWEYRLGHAPGAVNIPLSVFRARYAEIPKDILLICHIGQRSFAAAQFLRELGYTRLLNVEGGMDAWEAAGLPIET